MKIHGAQEFISALSKAISYDTGLWKVLVKINTTLFLRSTVLISCCAIFNLSAVRLPIFAIHKTRSRSQN